ncbi:MAG TPA: hypothetical protein VMS01_03545 [Stellaceae bacterium]|nr:hypothetical protein [Stellaceae bacterium]
MLNVSGTALAAASLLFLFQSATGPPARGGERHVLLTNNTHEPIVEIYISDDGARNWQVDLLGSDFLPPGGSVLIDVDDRNGNCRIDVRTVLDDGSDLVSHGVNVCHAEGYAVSVR